MESEPRKQMRSSVGNGCGSDVRHRAAHHAVAPAPVTVARATAQEVFIDQDRLGDPAYCHGEASMFAE
jgi:hypothetical protein